MILSMEKTMLAKVIDELKSTCRYMIFPETYPRAQFLGTF